MVSKVLAGHSFYGSIRYICRDEQRAEVLATEGVRAHDYRLMIQDFALQAELNSVKRQACFHSILSFYPGENVSNDTMVTIAGRYLKELGITNTQYAITKHTDKAHLHLHIIANMVDNNGRSIKDNWIGLRGKKIAQALTQEYRLIPALKKNLARTNLEALSESEATKYKIFTAIQEQLPQCKTLEELEVRLKKSGIDVQYKYKSGTEEKQGISFRFGETCFKGSQVDRHFSLGNLEKALQLQRQQLVVQENRPGQKREAQNVLMDQKQRDQASVPCFERFRGRNNSLAKQAEKSLEHLLKAEHSDDSIPYQLTQKASLQKKKKRSQRISR